MLTTAEQTANPLTHAWSASGTRPPAVLLIHGFTGSPASLRPMAEALAGAGHPVDLPLLPGHATRWQDLNQTRWQEWYARVDDTLSALLAAHGSAVVGGLSMGGALALRLAQLRGDDVSGLILVNPFVQIDDWRLGLLPVLKRVLPSLPGIVDDINRPGQTEFGYPRLPLRGLAQAKDLIDRVAGDLDRVTQPLLMLRSTVDHTIGTNSPQRVIDEVASTDLTDVRLTRSFHVATLDNDADVIHRESLAFLDRIGAPRDTESSR